MYVSITHYGKSQLSIGTKIGRAVLSAVALLLDTSVVFSVHSHYKLSTSIDENISNDACRGQSILFSVVVSVVDRMGRRQ